MHQIMINKKQNKLQLMKDWKSYIREKGNEQYRLRNCEISESNSILFCSYARKSAIRMQPPIKLVKSQEHEAIVENLKEMK